ncbi:MAG: DNA-binding transcriptional MerR regulator [Bacteriovoracaceae bacterium]|jgi:DNA-binding transcriptional MerR regulator
MNFEGQDQEKSCYKFNEVTSISGVKPYVLRFWESEFEQIQPSLSEAGHKIYSSKDLEFIHKIKNLLFEEKLSIPQAKSALDEEVREAITLAESSSIQVEPDFGDENYSGVALHSSSLDLMRNALKTDLIQRKEILSQKQFNDEDVLNLVQAKKKLTGVLTKINSIVTSRNW